ncbi:chorismate mutase [Caldicoprobacter guelmensis]|uniref:chorismate mutase n=1 Tax=Caldicoprobacter guelmensis TaxID=1170224 RepID=UPI0019578B4A|nr:chorismate mutase [Caldicoprobacter guelmensis]MBM7581337.1 chorismate mutase [Caldicoprobacter guelmensis]
MRVRAIRGAITVEENTRLEILNKTKKLLSTIIEKNDLCYEDIISIIFTATRDIDAVYPAVAAREMGLTQVPLLCCQEMYVEGSLGKCIRVLIHVQWADDRVPQHVYLEKAVNLRPDIAQT